MHAYDIAADHEGAVLQPRGLCAIAARLRRSAHARLAVKLAGTLIALGLAAFSLHGVPLSGMLARLAAFPRWAMVVALIASLAQVVLLAARLWLVFPRDERPAFLAVARAYAFGQLGNAILPGRSGDVVKIVALSRGGAADAQSRRPSMGDATGVVLVDKALDTLAFAGLAAVAGRGLIAGALAGTVGAAWIIVPVLALLALGALSLRRLRPSVFAKMSASARRTAATARRLLGPGRVSAGMLLGTAAWIAELVAMVALGVGVGLHLSVLQILRGLVVLNLGISVPVSVANVGTYEAATIAGLAPAGVPAGDAVALGALHHVVQLLAVSLSAFVFWARDRLAPRAAEEAPAALLLPAPAA